MLPTHDVLHFELDIMDFIYFQGIYFHKILEILKIVKFDKIEFLNF